MIAEKLVARSESKKVYGIKVSRKDADMAYKFLKDMGFDFTADVPNVFVFSDTAEYEEAQNSLVDFGIEIELEE